MNRQPQVSPSSSPPAEPTSQQSLFTGRQKQTFALIAGFWVISLFSLLFFKDLLWSDGGVPWGSDTFGHIYRFTFLQEAVGQGNWWPTFVPQWYLGAELFRYYPALAYYPLAAVNILLQDPITTTNLFLVVCAWLGGITWLLYHRWIGIWPAVLGGCLYIALPDLVRVAFSEGNLLRHFTSALIPLIFYLILRLLKSKGQPATYAWLAALFGLLVLGHPMMAAITAAMAALLVTLTVLVKQTEIRTALTLLTAIVLGILLSGFWLLPSLTGGITELSPEAVIAGLDVVPIWDLFSPTTRLHNVEALYVGAGIFSLAVFGLFASLKKRGEVFALSLSGLIGTLLVTPVFNPLYRAFPLASLMWPARFLAPASFLLLLASVWFLSRFSRKWLAVLFFAALFVDGWGGRALVQLNPADTELDQLTATLAETEGWREATLDQSRLGSAPSYLVSSTGGRDQVFGWGFQGAVTAELVSSLNEAIQMGNHSYLADRFALLGVDDVLLPTTLPLPFGLEDALVEEGFELDSQGGRIKLLHRDGVPRALQFEANILAIGKGAQNYAYLFPQTMVGSSTNIQDYTSDELVQFEMVILSGFGWDNLGKAEALVLQVVESGTRVVIDLHNTQEDPVARSPKFLDVWGEKVILPNEPLIAQTAQGSVTLAPFEYDGDLWYTITPQGLDEESITYDYLSNTAVISGSKAFGENQVLYIGANLAYHSITANDNAAIALLAGVLETEAMQVSDYTPVPLNDYQATSQGVRFSVQLNTRTRLLVPVSSFEGTRVRLDGNLVPHQNYYDLVIVTVPAGTHSVEITTTSTFIYTLGWITSLLAAFLFFMLLYRIGKKRNET